MHNSIYNYTQIRNRVLLEITGTIHGSAGDGHVAILLWLHAREIVDDFLEQILVRDVSRF